MKKALIRRELETKNRHMWVAAVALTRNMEKTKTPVDQIQKMVNRFHVAAGLKPVETEPVRELDKDRLEPLRGRTGVVERTLISVPERRIGVHETIGHATATVEEAPNNANPILKTKLSCWKETLDVTPEEKQKYIESKENHGKKVESTHTPAFDKSGASTLLRFTKNPEHGGV